MRTGTIVHMPMDVRSRAAEWDAAGRLLVYACLLWGHSVPPSLTDYANWTYQGVLLRDHLLGHADAAHALKPYPVPNSAATLGIGFLSLLLPWTIAAKAWLCVQLAAGLFALKLGGAWLEAGRERDSGDDRRRGAHGCGGPGDLCVDAGAGAGEETAGVGRKSRRKSFGSARTG